MSRLNRYNEDCFKPRKNGFKRKLENVFAVIVLAIFLVPMMVATIMSNNTVKGAEIAPEQPTAYDITDQMTDFPIKAQSAVPYKIGASDKQNEYVAYAWEISQDMDFIYMIESESGWVLDRVSGYNSNGHRDWGLGQISSYWHPEIINDPRFQNNDWRWELDTCLRLYDGGTKFYGADRLKQDKSFYEAVSNNFNWR